ncbi:energy transducer TonB [Methylocystis echinoides]|uniref:Energy transducer TonB n=1 Tax=Methylocystis echinoides TaxID=29468 RepID=A0A9W6GRJ7_9HYPH|nr:energy transducer TonB [Methylocystis echinoides]GLI91772.1 hypothetical protein LMG27198_07640 [Methylocystis echinoides]
MNVLTCGRVALACALAFAAPASAQAPKPPAPAPTPPQAAQSAQSAPQPVTPAATPAATPKPAAPPPAATVPAAPPAALSESKYLSLLYSEIARHTPEDSPAGPGEVTASFIVGPAGKIVKVTIDKTTSPAHAEIVKKILSEVVTPPPPGGSMDIGQTFKFY